MCYKINMKFKIEKYKWSDVSGVDKFRFLPTIEFVRDKVNIQSKSLNLLIFIWEFKFIFKII